MNFSERDKSSFILCPDKGLDTEIRPNKKKIEFIACNPKEMLESGKQLVSEILVPLTAKEDLYSNDYEGLNSVVQKIPNSNLQEKSFLG